MYSERQENLGTEEGSRNVESNRENNYCFGAKSVCPSMASLSACSEHCCILQTLPGFAWITWNIMANVYHRGHSKSSHLHHLVHHLEQVMDSVLQKWLWSWWRDISPPDMAICDNRLHDRGREAQKLSEVQLRCVLRLIQGGPAQSIETLGPALRATGVVNQGRQENIAVLLIISHLPCSIEQ